MWLRLMRQYGMSTRMPPPAGCHAEPVRPVEGMLQFRTRCSSQRWNARCGREEGSLRKEEESIGRKKRKSQDGKMKRREDGRVRWEERGRCLYRSARAALFGFLHRGCQIADQFIRFRKKTAQVGVPWMNAALTIRTASRPREVRGRPA